MYNLDMCSIKLIINSIVQLLRSNNLDSSYLVGSHIGYTYKYI